ncbi:6-carboxytetrahydropterin synthase [Pontibacter sp. JAM-7]|uniref:6-carboxytetrahydropterin synthase n=1 Tax=Pontibacter sp. JAM-7 TaxID=3366581 RepID=UPI003AF46AA4
MKLFVDNLTHVDFSYLHPERGLLGESWSVLLELDGSLNEQGMICDFGIVKKQVKQWLDRVVDHALVVPAGMQNLECQQQGGYTEVHWRYPSGEPFFCRSPDQAITLIDASEITDLTLADWCHDQLLSLFPAEVKGLNIRFVCEQINGAFYHYSHGLQQHDGNCQRIAHGHRSKIEIFIDGERDTDLEQHWAEQLSDIYIGTRSHLQSEQAGEHNYRYQAPQGEFALSLPARCCHVIDTESTVERIAEHVAKVIKHSYPERQVLVRAYEGIGKGAIAQV